MKKHYTQIIWGIIFIFININFGIFDILPDFIGYALLALGLDGLGKVKPVFRKGSYPSIVMLFLALILLFFPINNTLLSYPVYLGITAISRVIVLAVFYFLCQGIYLILSDFNTKEPDKNDEFLRADELLKSLKIRWNLLFGCTAMFLVVSPFLLNFRSLITVTSFCFSFILLILAMSIVDLLRKVRDYGTIQKVEVTKTL